MVINGKRIVRNPMKRAEVDAVLKDACERMGVPELFKKISWEFNVRYTRALGRADYRKNHIQLSSKLFSLATSAQREDTIRHEAAHLAVAYTYPDRAFLSRNHPRAIKPHGYEWKRFAVLAGATPKAVSKRIEGSEAIRGNRRRFTTYCGCPEPHMVSKTIYDRLNQGTRYTCRSCRSSLSLHPPVRMAADTAAPTTSPSKPKPQQPSHDVITSVERTLTLAGVQNKDVRTATGPCGATVKKALLQLVKEGKARKSGHRFTARYHRVS